MSCARSRPCRETRHGWTAEAMTARGIERESESRREPGRAEAKRARRQNGTPSLLCGMGMRQRKERGGRGQHGAEVCLARLSGAAARLATACAAAFAAIGPPDGRRVSARAGRTSSSRTSPTSWLWSGASGGTRWQLTWKIGTRRRARRRVRPRRATFGSFENMPQLAAPPRTTPCSGQHQWWSKCAAHYLLRACARP